MASPYAGHAEDQWKEITNRLIAEHPLSKADLLDASVEAWQLIWQTTIGKGELSVALADTDPPATVIGYFFEKLLARVLSKRFPGVWRGVAGKDEKDLVYIPDLSKSIEVKASGQLGLKIFGNRSVGQTSTTTRAAAKPEKSGFYLTVNFYETTLTLLRFGWIDHSDWTGQAAQTGQMAGLPSYVYEKKLVALDGDYRLFAPVGLLNGVGEGKERLLADLGIRTIADLLGYAGNSRWVAAIKEVAARNYQFPRAEESTPAEGLLPLQD